MRVVPRQPSTHTHCICGSTSQPPSGRTPPQGPLRTDLGQFIGHAMPLRESRQWPHMRQSNISPLTLRSSGSSAFSTRA